MRTYYVYILTNPNRTTLYIGVTNSLVRRMQEHHEASYTNKGFSGRYKTKHLLYFEEFDRPSVAIAREKELKGWKRDRKEALIAEMNPEWKFLEFEIM